MSRTNKPTTPQGGAGSNRTGTGRGGRRLLIVAVVAVAAVIVLGLSQTLTTPVTGNQPPTTAATASPSAAAGAAAVVRENSHRLESAPDGKVTLVEFLDFECESCGAVHPAIEELRQEYRGRVTFVVRYFPLDGHFNSKRAARAVQAAAQQGKFEAMYQKMFSTQKEWAEQQTPKDDVFRGYAAGLGLDMTQWDADYASAATAARVQADIDDALALGLTGTPSFFLNGEPFEPQSEKDLVQALDDALAA